MRLQAHRAAVERPSVVAPELDEAAAVGIARDLAAAVLKARIHPRSVGAEGETSRLVAVIHRPVGLEYGVAIARLVECVHTRRLAYETNKTVEVSNTVKCGIIDAFRLERLTSVFGEVKELSLLSAHEVVGRMLKLPVVHREVFGVG